MISIHDWRAQMKEGTADPISNEKTEPDARDWEFYHTKIQGRAKTYLKWFVDEVEGQQLSLVKKGFIVQDVMDALGLNISQLVRVTSNIKRALQKKQHLTNQMQQQVQPNATSPPTPTSSTAPPPDAGMQTQPVNSTVARGL
jgi:hypothetical protein